MIRPLRLEFPAALYHVTARGDRREAIFEDDHFVPETRRSSVAAIPALNRRRAAARR